MTIELSDTLVSEKGLDEAKFKMELAIFLFQQEFFTLGKASEFCEMPQFIFQKELAKRKIAVHYDVEDYRRDFNTFSELFNLTNKMALTIHPNYITNEQGKRLAVQLPIDEWENILVELKGASKKLKSSVLPTRKKNIKKAVDLLLNDYLYDKELTVSSGVDGDKILEYA